MQCERPRFDPLVGKIPWRRERLSNLVFWPGKCHGQSMGSQSQTQVSNFHSLSFFTQLWIVWDLGKRGWAWLSDYVSSCGSGQACACVLNHSYQSFLTPCDPMDCNSPGSSVHGDFSGKNTGVGCHALLQRIFPTQGLNLCLLCLSVLASGFFTTSTTWKAYNEELVL